MTIDLSSTYLGMKLRSPIIASACPLTGNLDVLARLEDAGAGAAVLPSLFEEQIEFEERMFGELTDLNADACAEAAMYFPELDTYNTGPDEYLRLVEEARKTVRMPIIASLNGVTSGGWTRYARMMEGAGASAIELNTYYLSTDPDVSAERTEQNYLDLVLSISESIRIPLAVKLSPFFSSLPNFARNLASAGADGLVLFNRFFQPDLDVDHMVIDSQMELSSRMENRLPMRWIAILDPLVDVSLAANSGIHTADDVLKMLLVGADAVMIAAALIRNGPEYVTVLLDDLRGLLQEHGYLAVSQLRGSFNHRKVPNPGAFERHNYMKALTSFGENMN